MPDSTPGLSLDEAAAALLQQPEKPEAETPEPDTPQSEPSEEVETTVETSEEVVEEIVEPQAETESAEAETEVEATDETSAFVSDLNPWLEDDSHYDDIVIPVKINGKEEKVSLSEMRAKYQIGGASEERLNSIKAEKAEFEAEKERLAERSLEHQKKIADQSLKLDIETAAIRIKQQKNSAQAERQIAALEHAAKLRELEKLEEVDEASRANRVQAAEIELNQKLKQIDRANYERIKTARAARAKAELAEQKNRINAQSALEMARINQNLKGEQNATNRKIALADLAFNRASQLLDLEADKNANSQTLKEALEINHQNRLTEIRDKAEADRIAKEQAAARELIASETALKEDILEIERLRAEVNLKGQDRELELLRLDYEQKFMMAKGNSEKILLLREQQSQQITAIQSRETEQLLDLTSDFFGSYGQGLADAAVGAIMFGESFSESIKAVLDGLAREAGVQALMELAKGTAALFTNPAGSGAHFKAAGLFGAAAILAKGAGSALAGGSSASAAGASGQASSPSGAPQTASAPRREQAEERTMVFNVNFSNSVIYDTKQAAQDAMVDQLVRNINTPRRGSRRVRFANA